MNKKKEWAIIENMMAGNFITTDAKGDSYIRVPDESALRKQVQYFRSLGYMVNKQDRYYAVLSKPGIPGIVEIQTIKAEIETGRHAKDGASLDIMRALSQQFTEAKIAAMKAGAMELEFDFGDGTKKHLYWDGGNWAYKPNSMELKYNKNRGGIYKAKFDPSKVKAMGDASPITRLYAKNKKHLQDLVHEYREKGWIVTTYQPTLVELEHKDKPGIIVIDIVSRNK